jgi:hypothetical protein
MQLGINTKLPSLPSQAHIYAWWDFSILICIAVSGVGARLPACAKAWRPFSSPAAPHADRRSPRDLFFSRRVGRQIDRRRKAKQGWDPHEWATADRSKKIARWWTMWVQFLFCQVNYGNCWSWTFFFFCRNIWGVSKSQDLSNKLYQSVGIALITLFLLYTKS